jgi:mono/diheme cytochrome c family protein
MRQACQIGALALLAMTGCRERVPTPTPRATAFGSAIVIVGGDKQAVSVGGRLDQPLVVQVNDAQGNGVAGVLVQLGASGDVLFDPPFGLTGGDGQFSAAARLGGVSGWYHLVANTEDRSGHAHSVVFHERALNYQQTLGLQLSEKHCVRCHDNESTAERVSNHDNLTVPPHALTDGGVLNPISDSNLVAVISHGGPALGQSAEMPPYTPTLSGADIDALVAYIRAVADPPYRPQGVFDANR